ncbi:uncharacterized protein TRIADDRAFT_64321 [Trichoplax adhaerens]|uniref:phosphatidate phosphatase n=1 Tax=Trichoplax adhaerens TaxID=10228 RepID=B3SA39_TRIAD|nr:hypothetical protein TRIADDRAFT_64321 [Trichoplax adhaerens]EDV20453.1 hypothetical protein TRIADDRAFT_64321 [Trichoplax adhaerens]|eukprot:XP_002117147.1 hypothetical protein TRIADDRAFT_64321 [Trichoplax adhaerens]
MDYIGKLVSLTKEFYNGINPATLTGAIDVIVIEQPDGSYSCSPFHVRFGKLGVLRSRQKVVDIEINNQSVPDIFMKLGDAGEAFFVEETDAPVPSFLSTSPITTFADDSIEPSHRNPHSEQSISPSNDVKVDIENKGDTVIPVDGDHNKLNENALSDSEITAYSSISEAISIPSRKSEWEGLRDHDGERYLFSDGDISPTRSSPVDAIPLDSHTSPHSDTEVELHQSDTTYDDFEENWNWDKADKEKTKEYTENNGSLIRSMIKFISRKDSQKGEAPTEENDGGIYLSELSKPDVDPEVTAKYLRSNRSKKSNSYDSNEETSILQREMHRELSLPTVAATGSTSNNKVTHLSESLPMITPSLESENTSKDYADIAISSCGYNSAINDPNSQEKFNASVISYEEFCANPNRLFDDETVVRIADNYYTWQVAIPMVMSMMLYQQPLPQTQKSSIGSWFSWRSPSPTKKAQIDNKVPRKHRVSNGEISASDEGTDDESTGSKENIEANNNGKKSHGGDEVESFCSENYKKALRLSSDQLKKLNLKKGDNTITYSVSSKYQGTASVSASIYLWNYKDKIVISDIDGTITKSDVMGQILPVFGRDWTQNGVAEFFSKVKKNGYQFIYLSARSIGQSSITKNFLKSVTQGNINLPDGPLMLSPSSLIKSFHREVIEKKPEKFKIGCLRDLQKLFPENPYYSGFGNRLNDAFSYRAVGIPVGRIFTINTKGEIRNDLINTFQSSYMKLGELVDHMFPPILYSNVRTAEISRAEYNDFNYWKVPLANLNLNSEALEGVVLPHEINKKANKS